MIAYVRDASKFTKGQEVEFEGVEGKFIVKKSLDKHELEVNLKQSKQETIIEFAEYTAAPILFIVLMLIF